MILAARPPFSLPAVVGSHGWVQMAPFAWDGDRGTLSYVTRLASGQVVEFQISQAGDGVTVETADGLEPAERVDAAAQVSWMLGLDQDLSPFYTLARDEPKLAKMVDRGAGRVLRCPTLFEDTVKTILTTNTAWSGTRRMAARLVERYGEPLAGDPTRRAFPAPAALAAAGPEALRAAGLGYRGPYVAELAAAVASGEIALEALKTADLPTPELRRRLLALKGVGAYAAANLLMLLGRYDYVPVDSWALKVVSHEFHDGQPIGPAEVEAVFTRWGQWKGLAYWFWDWSYFATAQETAA